MTDIAPLVAELQELLAEDEAARAEGQKRGVMPAYHGRSVTAEARLLRGVRAILPTLLDALTNSAGIEEGDTKESYWLDEVLRRNGPCPTCGTIGMLGTVEDKLATPSGPATPDFRPSATTIATIEKYERSRAAVQAEMSNSLLGATTPSGSGTDEEVERLASQLEGYARSYDHLHRDIADDFRKAASKLRSIAALSARSGEVALEQKPVVHHLGVALQNVADYHADVLNPREIKALYAAAALLWDDPRAALKEAGR